LRLFHEHGVEGVTVEQICHAAGIAPATFYRHFGTKDGVLFAYRERFLEVIGVAAAEVLPADTPGGQLKRILLFFADFLDEHADGISTRDAVVARNPVLLPRTLLIQREWENELARTLAHVRGVAATDPHVWWDAALGLTVIRAAFRGWRSGIAPTMRESVVGSFEDAIQAHERLEGYARLA
jgi:AcrR family transcriptional regulator